MYVTVCPTKFVNKNVEPEADIGIMKTTRKYNQ